MFTPKPANLKIVQQSLNKYRLSEGLKTLIVEKKPYNQTIRWGRYTIQSYEDGFDVYITTPWTQIGTYEFSDTNAQFYQTVNPADGHQLQYTMPIQKKMLPAQTQQNPALFVQANTIAEQQGNFDDDANMAPSALGAYVNLLYNNNNHINSVNYMHSTDQWDDKELTMHDNYDGTIQNYYTTTAIKDNGNVYDGCTTTLSPNLQSNNDGKQYVASAPAVFSTFDYYRYNVPTPTENNIQ